jgi:hypothetical protein
MGGCISKPLNKAIAAVAGRKEAKISENEVLNTIPRKLKSFLSLQGKTIFKKDHLL